METFLGAFDERFVGLDLLVDGKSEECDDDAEEDNPADEQARNADSFRGETREVGEGRDDNRGKTANPGESHGVAQFNLLEKAYGDNACNRAEKRR